MRKNSSRPGDRSRKPAGIKEIAAKLNVSIGTVDRALHGRSGINAATAAKVLKAAEALGYKPNVAARLLKLNRKLVISVHLPKEIAAFFDLLRNSIIDAARPFQSSVELRFRQYPTLDEGDVAAFEQALGESVDGIIMVPGNPRLLQSLIKTAADRGTPVVCVASDAPNTERLTSISADPHVGGAMAAELLTRCVRSAGPVLVITGNLRVVDHTEKLRGFAERLSRMSSLLTLIPVLETHDHPAEADRKTREAIAHYPDIAAVYITTANSLPVLDALKRTGHLGKISIVTTDLFPELVPYIRRGEVLASIYQRPQSQGRIAFETIYHYLTDHRLPPRVYPLPPHLVLQSNLDLFLEIVGASYEDLGVAG
ncbi:MAG TPA: LacI family DNA-binding transcriptional regulator [Bryobacteraceae bacterium]|nr:LacI family DNA-binding transcriptional regulator [Bryobacteraceae bacterium]